MTINYSSQEVIKSPKSIFLAGPTPRNNIIRSWRIDAIDILEKIKFDGVVYVPELENYKDNYDYTLQTEWEYEALHMCSAIAFWIPRELTHMPAFTTNVEFGYWISKEASKVIYGRPTYAVKVKYLDWLYEKETCNKPVKTLHEVIEKAVNCCDINFKKIKELEGD